MKMKDSIISLAAVAFPNPTKGFGNFFLDLSSKPGGNTVRGILLFGINLLLSVSGLIAVLFIIIGGFQYITSRGNEEQAETGKRTLTNAIIGVVVIVLSFAIVRIVSNTFSGYYR